MSQILSCQSRHYLIAPAVATTFTCLDLDYQHQVDCVDTHIVAHLQTSGLSNLGKTTASGTTGFDLNFCNVTVG